jgi:Protein kinase domain
MIPSSERVVLRDSIREQQRLAATWARAVARYFPVRSGFWRYNTISGVAKLPHAGWKIHVSATVLNACDTLERVASVLDRNTALAKCPASLSNVVSLNQGIAHSYSQVGKIFTIYTKSTTHFQDIAQDLVSTTSDCSGWPDVPFERRIRADRPIFYRYGVLDPFADASVGPWKIRSPTGEMVDDLRSQVGVPSWVIDPFHMGSQPRFGKDPPRSPTFVAFDALSQRGKGGVYLAIDLKAVPPRLCVMKEGRAHGETDFDGVDGRRRVLDEAHALCALQELRLIPRVSGIEELDGNVYLKLTPFAGVALTGAVARRMSGNHLRTICIALTKAVSDVHEAGWIWSDCKPANILFCGHTSLYLLDFEGACEIGAPGPAGYGTPGYAPPRHQDSESKANIADDIFALGVVLHELCGGHLDTRDGRADVDGYAWRVPAHVETILAAMRSTAPTRRPPLMRLLNDLILSDDWKDVDAGS